MKPPTSRLIACCANIVMLTAIIAVGVILVLAVFAPADAATPARSVPNRVTCSDEYRHPSSGQAKTCREAGWTVTSRYLLTPGRVPVYIDLPSCGYEDGSTDRTACTWNVNSGDGNGVGLRYIVTNVRSASGVSGKRYIYLRECFGARCHTSAAG